MVHKRDTFMVEVESLTISLKIIPFWVTSWLYKKVSYKTLACNYGISIVICWWYFCNKWFHYSDIQYCIRRVRLCSYGKNCAWYIKIIVILLYVIILIKCFLNLQSKEDWFQWIVLQKLHIIWRVYRNHSSKHKNHKYKDEDML